MGDFVVCGRNLAELKPSNELRWKADPSGQTRPILQQKWVAQSKMPDGDSWEESRWIDVPFADD